MAPSDRYNILKLNVLQLRNALLPEQFDPTGTYTDANKAHLQALSFRLLAHAEVEAFIEDIADLLFQAGWAAWDENRVPSAVVVGLLAFSGKGTQLPPEKLGGPRLNQLSYDNAHTPLQQAQANWRSAKTQNHGLKEENVLRLFLPLGIDASALDTTLLADLSSFGSERGHVAHSSAFRVTTYADPKGEFERINKLIDDMEALDSAIMDALAQLDRIKAVHASSTPVAATVAGTESGNCVFSEAMPVENEPG